MGILTYTHHMKYCMIVVGLMSACGFAQPTPRVDESFDEYEARYVQWYDSVPEQDQAWPEMQAIDVLLKDQLDGMRLTTDPTADAWDASVDFVQDHGELVEQIWGYSTHAHLAIPPSGLFKEDPSEDLPKGIGILLPNLGMIGTQSRMLVIDAILASEAGDHERVLTDIRTVRDLQRFIPVANTTIEMLVDILIGSIVSQAILANQIDLSGWSKEDLDQLALLFQPPDIQAKMIRAVSVEGWMVQDMLNWVYEDSANGQITILGAKRLMGMARMLDTLDGDTFSGESVEGLSALARATSLKRDIRSLEDQIALSDRLFQIILGEANTPTNVFHKFQSSVLIEELASQKVNRFEYLPVLMIIPELSRSYRRFVQAKGVDSAAAILVALHRHHRRHGAFPASLDRLDADFVHSSFVDPYTGQPFKYKLIDGKPLVYSLGPDRDDDGGKPILNEEGDAEYWPDFLTLDELETLDEDGRAAIDGDWVLYPMIP